MTPPVNELGGVGGGGGSVGRDAQLRPAASSSTAALAIVQVLVPDDCLLLAPPTEPFLVKEFKNWWGVRD